MKKKAQFNLINQGLIAFVGFILVVILTILMISIFKQTSIACSDPTGVPVRYSNNDCRACPSTAWIFNTTSEYCCNATGGTTHCLGANQTPTLLYSGNASVGLRLLQNAAILPPQFASVIIIVIITIGVLAMLAIIGYNAYQKMKQ